MGAQYNSTSIPLSSVPGQVHPLHWGVHWFLSLGFTEGRSSTSKIPNMVSNAPTRKWWLGSSWFMGARPGIHKRHHREPEPLVNWMDGLEPCARYERRWPFWFSLFQLFCKQCNGYYNDGDKVQIGQTILWTRQSLSTATLTSSTSSRCTTPLLTSGGDSFERFFLNIFHQQVPPRGLVQSGAHSRGIRCWPSPGFNFDIVLRWTKHFL